MKALVTTMPGVKPGQRVNLHHDQQVRHISIVKARNGALIGQILDPDVRFTLCHSKTELEISGILSEGTSGNYTPVHLTLEL